MKKKSEELDVDFIGSQDKLTKEEELALSNYFSKRRAEGSNILKTIPKPKRKKVNT
jgi:hypothetical protein